MLGRIRDSKLKLSRGYLVAVGMRGGLPGVRMPQDAVVGLGVRFTKSAKLNCWLEVPEVTNMSRPSVGVIDGKTACWLGGMEGEQTW